MSIKMQKKIMIVDDHEDAREMMRFSIENFGYEVIEAAGPYEAIDKAAELQPDLILMDVGMPLLDGFSATDLLKAQRATASIPVVIVTGYSDVHSQASRSGCVDVIYKPVDFDKLSEVLARHTAGSIPAGVGR